MKRYTELELEVIKESIALYPNNITFACEIAALKIKRNAKAVLIYYYNNLKKKDTLLAIGSKHGALSNTKNTPRPANTDFNPTLIDSMLVTAFNSLPKEKTIKFFLGNMSNEDKITLLNRIVNKISK